MSQLVDMAIVDEKGVLQTRKVAVASVTVNIKCRARNSVGHILNDVIAGTVRFKPGEIKRLEVSEALVAELKAEKLARRRGTFELTHEPPSQEETEAVQSDELAEVAEAEEVEEAPARVRRRR